MGFPDLRSSQKSRFGLNPILSARLGHLAQLTTNKTGMKASAAAFLITRGPGLTAGRNGQDRRGDVVTPLVNDLQAKSVV